MKLKIIIGIVGLLIILGIIGALTETEEPKEPAEIAKEKEAEEAKEEREVVKEEEAKNQEEKEQIATWIDSATKYELDKLEIENDDITVWINLENEAIDNAENLTKGLTERIVELYEYEATVSVTAMQRIDEETVRGFGNSLFTPAGGKVEYEPY